MIKKSQNCVLNHSCNVTIDGIFNMIKCSEPSINSKRPRVTRKYVKFSVCMINLAFNMHFLLITLCLSLVTLQWAELSFSYENNNAELQIYSNSTLIYRKSTHQMTILCCTNKFINHLTNDIAEFFPRNRNINTFVPILTYSRALGLITNFSTNRFLHCIPHGFCKHCSAFSNVSKNSSFKSICIPAIHKSFACFTS